MCRVAHVLVGGPARRLLGAARSAPGWRQRLCMVLLCSILGLAVAGCQPAPRPELSPSAPSEPRSLPTLAPPPRSTPGTVLPGAEPRTALAAAEALRASGDYIQARQAFADLVRRYPRSEVTDQALLALGDILTTLEQHVQAATYYRALLERFPRSARLPEAHLGLGVALYHQQDDPHSLQALQQYLKLRPSGAQRGLAHYYLGAVALRQQRYPDAIAALTAAVETSSDPQVVRQAREHIAGTIRETLTVEALATLAPQYDRTYPGDLMLERLAQEYRHMGDRAAEAEALRRLTRAFPAAPGIQEAQARWRSLQAQQTTEPSKLGVLLPLSGPGRRAGMRALQGIELALAMMQERGTTTPLSLAVRDSAQSTAAAQAALQALVHEERVIGVIGPLFSRTAIELAPLADQLGVPVISPYARDSDFPVSSAYTLRNSLTDAMQGHALAEYATDVLRLRRFVILHPDDPYGHDLSNRFRDQILRRQGDIVAVLSYPASSPNVDRAIARLKELQYEALFLPEYADTVGRIVAQLAARNIKDIQLLGSDGWNAPRLVEQHAGLLEGAIFVDGFFANAPSPAVRTFVEQFRARYDETPDLLAAQAYDTLLMCAQVLHAGAQTPAQLREGLVQLHDFAGVSGLTTMGGRGDAQKVLYLLTVKDGQIVQLNTTSRQ